jgi:hypothetical protein
MRHKTRLATVFATGAALSLQLTFAPPTAHARTVGGAPQQGAPAVKISDAERKLLATFEARVKKYVGLREGIEAKLPRLSRDATPEQIEAHKTLFQERVRAARAGARQGDLFTPEAVAFIRATIKDEFKGRERQELRREVLVEADTKAVVPRVNYPYPDTEELLEMSPTLLLRLPQLPKQVKYRFVGRNLLLVDRENALILDYMTDALP